jgi:hypothetical protein
VVDPGGVIQVVDQGKIVTRLPTTTGRPQNRGAPGGSGGSKRGTMAEQHPTITKQVMGYINSLGQTFLENTMNGLNTDAITGQTFTHNYVPLQNGELPLSAPLRRLG